MALRTPGFTVGLGEPSVRWRRGAAVLVAAVATLVVVGAVSSLADVLPAFHLGGELSHGFRIPVLFSTAVLLAAGCAAGVCAREPSFGPRYAWIVIGTLFAFMAVDELSMIHETAQESLDVDWQLLYLPLAAVGGVAWLAVLGSLREASAERAMWIAAAGAWVVSQVLEFVAFDAQLQPIAAERALDGIEKVLQLTGSTMFLLALLLLLDRRHRLPEPLAAY